MSGQQIAPWVQSMADAEPQFRSLAKAHNAVTWEAEANFARQIIGKSTKLQLCTPQSIIDAVINIAGVGLSLSPAMKEAYLVPRSRNINGKFVDEAHLDISYRGIVKLAVESGSVSWVQARLVYGNDTFALHGIDQQPTHTCDPFSTNRGEFVGAYCVARLPNGDCLTETMTAVDVYKIRSTSSGYTYAEGKGKNSPWHIWFEPMTKKSVVKQASKLWPPGKSPERFANAIRVLDHYSGNDDYDDGAAVVASTPEPITPEQGAALLELLAVADTHSEGFTDRWRTHFANKYGAADSPLGVTVPADKFDGIVADINKKIDSAKVAA